MLSFDNMKLLPIVQEPNVPPVDREMLPSERREFVNARRTCVFGTTRKADGPAMSIVYYIPTDTGELLVATMAERGKAKAVRRSEKVSLCILDERWPFAYLQVYANAVVETDPDLVVATMMAVGGRMSGEPLGEEARPFVDAMRIEEGRVVLRCTPYETFATPPRHLHDNNQEGTLTHWASGTVPWDAADPV